MNLVIRLTVSLLCAVWWMFLAWLHGVDFTQRGIVLGGNATLATLLFVFVVWCPYWPKDKEWAPTTTKVVTSTAIPAATETCW